MALNPTENLVWFVKLFFMNDEGYIGWTMFCEALFLIHFVVFLSLYIKWAAIPVAVAVNFAGFVMFAFMVNIFEFYIRPYFNSGGDVEKFFTGIATLFLLTAAVGLHVKIGFRLAQLARE